MVTFVAPLTTTRTVIEEDGSLTQEARDWMQTITDQAVIIGTGSPESVVEANVTAMYMDDAGTAGSILYVKRDADIGGDATQGWILC
ncbi:hypothetical protein KAR91_46325 [Candidatus Pacearchaeota archaeon]|nr:hypothetical protein [Candidatus Pacearchaeota archaeon]